MLPRHKSLVSAEGRFDLRAEFNVGSLVELNRVGRWWDEMQFAYDEWDYALDEEFLSLVLDLVLDRAELNELVRDVAALRRSRGQWAGC